MTSKNDVSSAELNSTRDYLVLVHLAPCLNHLAGLLKDCENIDEDDTWIGRTPPPERPLRLPEIAITRTKLIQDEIWRCEILTSMLSSADFKRPILAALAECHNAIAQADVPAEFALYNQDCVVATQICIDGIRSGWDASGVEISRLSAICSAEAKILFPNGCPRKLMFDSLGCDIADINLNTIPTPKLAEVGQIWHTNEGVMFSTKTHGTDGDSIGVRPMTDIEIRMHIVGYVDDNGCPDMEIGFSFVDLDPVGKLSGLERDEFQSRHVQFLDKKGVLEVMAPDGMKAKLTPLGYDMYLDGTLESHLREPDTPTKRASNRRERLVTRRKQMPISIFIALSSTDDEHLVQIEKHLSLLKRQGKILPWNFRMISGGREWEDQIDHHINSARVILLLISSDFIASDYCWGVEMKRALERHESGEARVVPIILRPCDWHSAGFGKLQALPRDGREVTGSGWSTRDAAYADIAKGIRQIVDEIGAKEQHHNRAEHEQSIRESLDAHQSAKKRDDDAYALIIEEFANRSHMEEWQHWSYDVLSHGQPCLDSAVHAQLVELGQWLLKRIWPGRYQEFENSILNFRLVLQDFLTAFGQHSVEIGNGYLETAKFYKSGDWDKEDYELRVTEYEQHVDLVQNLMLELTRAANYVCDNARESFLPSFRLSEGALVVRTGPDMHLRDKTLRLEYRDMQRTATPYPGLERFQPARVERDYWFGE
jgi:hypothetical protein